MHYSNKQFIVALSLIHRQCSMFIVPSPGNLESQGKSHRYFPPYFSVSSEPFNLLLNLNNIIYCWYRVCLFVYVMDSFQRYVLGFGSDLLKLYMHHKRNEYENILSKKCWNVIKKAFFVCKIAVLLNHSLIVLLLWHCLGRIDRMLEALQL